jgi:aminoglycoside/choline kinase family phosphotransferase
MKEQSIILKGYKKLFNKTDIDIQLLPKSGSDRKYFRINDGNKSIIAAYNDNIEENEAFIGFTKHFRSKKLPVPEIYGYIPEENVYYIQDLGDTSLFVLLKNKHGISDFDEKDELIYAKVLEILIRFQKDGIKGLNLDLCYPHRSFDRQSMMWDMNYFKYMFLKLMVVSFNEKRLEHDFDHLADFLLETDQDFFLYRDFQSANIMLNDGEPWFIDYQGGRKGAPQYDVASLLLDSKAHVPVNSRIALLDGYIGNFCWGSAISRSKFRDYYSVFCLIRLMQALGAFGFRGLYEKKPTFTGSIVPGVRLINEILDNDPFPINLPELFKAIKSIKDSNIYKELEDNKTEWL